MMMSEDMEVLCTKPNWELGENRGSRACGVQMSGGQPRSKQSLDYFRTLRCTSNVYLCCRVLYPTEQYIITDTNRQINKRCASTDPDSDPDPDPDPDPLTGNTDYTTPELDGASYGATQPHTNPILENQQLLREYGNQEWNDEEQVQTFCHVSDLCRPGTALLLLDGELPRYSTCACVNSILRRRSVRISQEGCAFPARMTQGKRKSMQDKPNLTSSIHRWG